MNNNNFIGPYNNVPDSDDGLNDGEEKQSQDDEYDPKDMRKASKRRGMKVTTRDRKKNKKKYKTKEELQQEIELKNAKPYVPCGMQPAKFNNRCYTNTDSNTEFCRRGDKKRCVRRERWKTSGNKFDNAIFALTTGYNLTIEHVHPHLFDEFYDVEINNGDALFPEQSITDRAYDRGKRLIKMMQKIQRSNKNTLFNRPNVFPAQMTKNFNQGAFVLLQKKNKKHGVIWPSTELKPPSKKPAYHIKTLAYSPDTPRSSYEPFGTVLLLRTISHLMPYSKALIYTHIFSNRFQLRKTTSQKKEYFTKISSTGKLCRKLNFQYRKIHYVKNTFNGYDCMAMMLFPKTYKTIKTGQLFPKTHKTTKKKIKNKKKQTTKPKKKHMPTIGNFFLK
jgi:hypothetical protein